MVVNAKLGEFSGICKSGSVIFCGDSGNCGFRVGRIGMWGFRDGVMNGDSGKRYGKCAL